MRKFWAQFPAALGVAFVLSASPASAQAVRTWVSGVGDDANPCSRTAPCKTFAGAISKTAAAGEINCLDAGGFGAVTITKSITIRCEGLQAGVQVAQVNGITINAAPTDKVTIRGLDIDGTMNSNSLNGINVVQAADVLIENTTVHGFVGPNSAGVLVNTTATTRVVVSHSTLHTNTYGVSVTSSGGTGKANVLDSLLDDNLSGGIVVNGAGNDVQIINNRILGANGLSALNGGTIRSYGDNMVPSAGNPTSTVPTK